MRSATELQAELERAQDTLTDPRERELLGRLERQFDGFMALDAVAWRKLQAGLEKEVREIFLGPELERFEAMAATAEQLAGYEAEQAVATDSAFDDARDEARRRLVAVALGAALVIVLLLVTANDIARMALEGERSVRGRRPPAEPPS